MPNLKVIYKYVSPLSWYHSVMKKKTPVINVAREIPKIKGASLNSKLLGTDQHTFIFQHATSSENILGMYGTIAKLGFDQALKLTSAKQARAEGKLPRIKYPESEDFLSGQLSPVRSAWGKISLISPFTLLREQPGIHKITRVARKDFDLKSLLIYFNPKANNWFDENCIEISLYSHFDADEKTDPKESGIKLFPWFLIVAKEEEIQEFKKVIESLNLPITDEVKLLNMLVIKPGSLRPLVTDLEQCAELFYPNLHLAYPREFKSVAAVKDYFRFRNAALIRQIIDG